MGSPVHRAPIFWLANGLIASVLALAVVSIAWPFQPFWLLDVWALAPIVCVGGGFAVPTKRASRIANCAAMSALPIVFSESVLAGNLVFSGTTLDLSSALVAGLLVGLPLAFFMAAGIAAAFRAWSRRRNWLAVALFALFAAAYPVTTFCLINQQFDSGPPTLFRTAVFSKHVSGFRGRNYIVDVAPWPLWRTPSPTPYRFMTPRALFDQLPVGAAVCVALHHGYLHARWLSLSRCPS